MSLYLISSSLTLLKSMRRCAMNHRFLNAHRAAILSSDKKEKGKRVAGRCHLGGRSWHKR
jgi:hypothetical protein